MCGLQSDVIATQTYLGELDSVRAARHFTVGLLARGSDRRLADDAAIVVTELAANAVLHARSGFTLTISRSATAIRIAVRDGRPLASRPGLDVRAGHGLSVVAQLARKWAVERRPDGKVVWAELAMG